MMSSLAFIPSTKEPLKVLYSVHIHSGRDLHFLKPLLTFALDNGSLMRPPTPPLYCTTATYWHKGFRGELSIRLTSQAYQIQSRAKLSSHPIAYLFRTVHLNAKNWWVSCTTQTYWASKAPDAWLAFYPVWTVKVTAWTSRPCRNTMG